MVKKAACRGLLIRKEASHLRAGLYQRPAVLAGTGWIWLCGSVDHLINKIISMYIQCIRIIELWWQPMNLTWERANIKAERSMTRQRRIRTIIQNPPCPTMLQSSTYGSTHESSHPIAIDLWQAANDRGLQVADNFMRNRKRILSSSHGDRVESHPLNIQHPLKWSQKCPKYIQICVNPLLNHGFWVCWIWGGRD